MNAKIAQFINKGMRQDLSIDKVSNEYAFENVNIRITENEDNTLLSVTNELGNSRLDIENPHADETPWYNKDFPSDVYGDALAIPGNLIGSCVIAENLVLFFTNVTENYPDAIIRIYKEGESLTWKLLYCGHLNFSTEHPIETLGDYESETSIKVYWVDGYNQARFINIVADDIKVASYTDTSFDFLPTINKFPEIAIERLDTIDNATGHFPSGVIQYAFTYSNLNGQESAVFYTSMLQYIMFKDRAGGPDEIVNCSFRIGIHNIDTSFDRLNIYSIYRSSYNGTPITKRVTTLNISLINNDFVSYIDNNDIGEIIDNTELFYKGGDYVIAGTLDQKDSVLFMGDLNIQRSKVTKDLLANVQSDIQTSNTLTLPDSSRNSEYFPYSSQSFSLDRYKYLKATEYYRIGYQLQDKYGKWSAPIYLKDYTHSLRPEKIREGEVEIPSTTLTLTFSSSFNTSLYKRVRAVIVLPNKSNRVCIGQGVVNPTVFRLKDRYKNAPYACASWFFRPIVKNSPSLVFQNCRLLADNSSLYGEIQTQDNLGSVSQSTPHNGECEYFNRKYAIINEGSQSGVSLPLFSTVLKNADYGGKTPTKEIGQSTSNTVTILGITDNPYFAVDTNIVTFNSPDLNTVTVSQLNDYKFRIVGIIPITKTYGLNYLLTDNSAEMLSPSGFYDYRHESTDHLLTYPSWIDLSRDVFYANALKNTESARIGYLLYPWHKEGPLTGHYRDTNNFNGGLLRRKVLSNTLYSDTTYFFTKKDIHGTCDYPNISTVSIYDEQGSSLIQISNPDSYNVINTAIIPNYFNYYGSVDTLSTPGYVSYPTYAQAVSREGDDNYTYVSNYEDLVNSSTKLISNIGYIKGSADASFPLYNVRNEYPNTANLAYSTDPVSIKYKSTKHAVFSLGFTPIDDSNTTYNVGGGAIVLPDTELPNDDDVKLSNFNGYGDQESAMGYPFWMNKSALTDSKAYDLRRYMRNPYDHNPRIWSDNNYLYLGELYRDIDKNSIFGGTSEFALAQNQWIPASEPQNINDNNSLHIIGDTMFQRWDCLKTYAYTDEDTNSITETLSFMVESQVNLDGRYDKNRGRVDNTTSSPENINLFNDVYNQENNYFNYRIFEDFYYTNTKFPNQFTWSLPKSPNSEVDNWTNITLSSVYNVDGSLGKINKIRRFRDVLFGFQDKGIFQILFNSRSQIATTTGVPIELANSGKVDGIRYLSTMEGCQNKWTICETPNGLYFIDDTNHSINRFSGENLEHLSTDKGFDRYMRNENNIWQHTFYDRNLKDVYFVSDNTCLAFSEKLNEFMSFYPGYQKTPLMCNLYDDFIAIDYSNGYYMAYKNHAANNYGNFFDDYYDYSITYRVAPEPYLDKIFTNIEYDAEMKQEGNDLPESFSELKTETDYQKGSLDLTKFPNLIRKFRKWRANIPREKDHPMDRMRGPWMTLTLTKKQSNENKKKQMEFHNLLVKYFV